MCHVNIWCCHDWLLLTLLNLNYLLANRLNTYTKNLCRERRELLEKLEAQRLQRMKKGPNEKSELSADALLSRKVQKKSDKILVSYDEDGKMNTNEEFDKALDNLKNKNRGIANCKMF